MSQYPHLWDLLDEEEITETTEIYTQRVSSSSPAQNFKMYMRSVARWVANYIAKIKFRADGPAGDNQYEYNLGGEMKLLGEKGIITRLLGNTIYTGPDLGSSPVDGQVWKYDGLTGKMKLGTGADMHIRINVAAPATEWVLVHNFGWVPNYAAYDNAGNELHGQRSTVDANTEKITFSVARSGYVDMT